MLEGQHFAAYPGIVPGVHGLGQFEHALAPWKLQASPNLHWVQRRHTGLPAPVQLRITPLVGGPAEFSCTCV